MTQHCLFASAGHVEILFGFPLGVGSRCRTFEGRGLSDGGAAVTREEVVVTTARMKRFDEKRCILTRGLVRFEHYVALLLLLRRFYLLLCCFLVGYTFLISSSGKG